MPNQPPWSHKCGAYDTRGTLIRPIVANITRRPITSQVPYMHHYITKALSSVSWVKRGEANEWLCVEARTRLSRLSVSSKQ
jgi:hypothetical protein